MVACGGLGLAALPMLGGWVLQTIPSRQRQATAAPFCPVV